MPWYSTNARKLSQAFYGISYIVLLNVFCWQMWKVNRQFEEFFKQIRDASYPRRAVKCVLGAYYIIQMASYTFRFCFFITGLQIAWLFLSNILAISFELFFFAMQTWLFLYFADLGKGNNPVVSAPEKPAMDVENVSLSIKPLKKAE